MKKITFILFALITGTTFAQNSASTTATATAEIVSPLTLQKDGDLNFGKIAKGAAGTVVVKTDGSRGTSTADVIGATTTVTPAKFSITAETGELYSISLPGDSDVVLENAAGTDMTVTDFKHNVTTFSGNQSFNVGATLNVNANQAPGIYTNTTTPFTVSVNYN
jgi:hypothetical protein